MDLKKLAKKKTFAEKTDDWLDENINQPLAKRGYETLGAGLSAAGSVLIPDSIEDAALSAVPGGKALSSINKLAGKVAPRLIEKLKKGKTLTKNETKRLAKAQSKSTKEKYTDTEMPSYSKATEAQKVQMDVDPNVLTYGRDVDKASMGKKLVERQGVQPPKSSKK